jgi:hypothetical protein
VNSDLAMLLSPQQRASVVEKLTLDLQRPLSEYVWSRPLQMTATVGSHKYERAEASLRRIEAERRQGTRPRHLRAVG